MEVHEITIQNGLSCYQKGESLEGWSLLATVTTVKPATAAFSFSSAAIISFIFSLLVVYNLRLTSLIFSDLSK